MSVFFLFACVYPFDMKVTNSAVSVLLSLSPYVHVSLVYITVGLINMN